MGSAFSSPKSISEVHVHFNKKKLRVVFSSEDYNEQKQVPIQQFRAKLAKSLNVPANTLVLYKLDPQKQMGNVKSTLDEYGVTTGSEILCVQQNAEPPKSTVKSPTQQIDDIVEDVEKQLGGRISNFIASPPADLKERDQENRVLCETILGKLISLDNVEVENADQRAARKAAIGKLQAYHKSIDQAMAGKTTSENTDQNDQPVVATETQNITETADNKAGTSKNETAAPQQSKPKKNKKKNKRR